MTVLLAVFLYIVAIAALVLLPFLGSVALVAIAQALFPNHYADDPY